MLLEIAIGDAYGAGFEYVDLGTVRCNNNLDRYYKHPRHKILPGRYTDDTQMSLAIAEAIIDDVIWTKQSMADYFVRAFKRDPRDGYAGGFFRFLQEVEDGRDFVERIRPNSDKSGAAMRSVPLGVFHTVQEVIEKCTVQASLTHDTVDGIAAANAVALMSHYFVYGLGAKKDVGNYVEDIVPHGWNRPWRGKVGSKGWMSVRAAITAIVNSDSLSELLKACVDFGGDVDTVAAVAMGAASSCAEMKQDIPSILFENVENGSYGRDYILDLDRKLLNSIRANGDM